MKIRGVPHLALLAVLMAIACDEPTPVEPSGEGPTATVNPWPSSIACYPTDVVNTRTIGPSGDTTETVLTGFEPCGVPGSGVFDMWLYGIELWDPTAESPQGTGRVAVRSDPSLVLNAPSGVSVAIQESHAPPQAIIEFEPAVREVSFAYSVRFSTRAIFGGDQIDDADSVSVLATTSSRLILAQRTLYSNSPAYPDPYQVWDTVTIKAGFGDAISLLWLNGQFAIDDLKIVSGPRPQVKCSKVTRGQLARCQVNPEDMMVVEWNYAPNPGSGLLPVNWQTDQTVWSGTAVHSGAVNVVLTDGVDTIAPFAFLLVEDRPSQWTQMWDYNSDSLQTVQETPIDVEGPDTLTIGRNCDRLYLCGEGKIRVTPWPIADEWDGATPHEISGGPNDGYWWIGAIRFDMYREGNLNPAVKPLSLRVHPVEKPSRSCWTALGFPNGNSVFANFYDYNKHCVKGKAYADLMLAGWWGHEGFGVNGGTGHESLARVGAAQPKNDAWLAADTLVRSDSLFLLQGLQGAIQLVSNRIKSYTADPNPTGNWTGAFWYYSQAESVWKQDIERSY